ncbi:reverse transcriptase domain-containing protein [Tanacetum coccineum]
MAIGGTLSEKGRTKLCSLLKENLDKFACKPTDMTEYHIIAKQLAQYPGKDIRLANKRKGARPQNMPKPSKRRAVEGMFLGYMISPEGIKPCPEKTEAVLRLPFLSKSAEKSLPLFKTLKKCIKKSDFHWTPEAEQAFKQLKQHLSELPMLVAPKQKEELIVYLSASHEAISAVLMTERDTVQTPVYFVSHALQGPELNYTPMEKLVLALVFVAKRL